jgi:hypothetical protein
MILAAFSLALVVGRGLRPGVRTPAQPGGLTVGNRHQIPRELGK